MLSLALSSSSHRIIQCPRVVFVFSSICSDGYKRHPHWIINAFDIFLNFFSLYELLQWLPWCAVEASGATNFYDLNIANWAYEYSLGCSRIIWFLIVCNIWTLEYHRVINILPQSQIKCSWSIQKFSRNKPTITLGAHAAVPCVPTWAVVCTWAHLKKIWNFWKSRPSST